ncbi:hypothetical protein CHU93_10590 [Sandarakinorhabdus cyanobacteriorum]|uniref:Uncharacterized protein n=2 Tax=Sandarakinorhabdus cyanobacteriorum TaxID=1981098 RepID=A0A255YGW0_9SPHN|nr:hypothetical protein CHU93_10590 [Sandarakinorhabdus cyanobacteriorum]
MVGGFPLCYYHNTQRVALMTDKQMLALAIGTILALVLNFLPTAIAYARRHPERALLARINILSILSFLLWLALMAWAVGGARNDAVINRFVHNKAQRPLLIGVLVLLVGGGLALTLTSLGQLPRLPH